MLKDRPTRSVRAQRAAGFTLIEMVVTMTIFALLVALTVPAMRTWVANSQVRAVAEALQNGIRLAQTEALRRSRQVVFTLTSTPSPSVGFTGNTTGPYWAAQTIPADPSETAVIVGSGPLTAGGSAPTISNFVVALCFNSVGRLVSQYATGVPGTICLVPTSPTLPWNKVMWPIKVSLPSADHQLMVEVMLSGQIHICDPAQPYASTGNPYGC
jgi:type IV fimbrial biogenesis protein FimT